MKIERKFLGWSRPLLHTSAEFLVEEFGFDLSELTLVVTTSRAGRRLIEILVSKSEEAGQLLVPPKQIVSVGSLPELFYSPGQVFATKVERILAWQCALEATQDKWLETLTRAAEEISSINKLSLAQRLDRLWLELSAAQKSFAQVADKTKELYEFGEEQRWIAFDFIFNSYIQSLSAVELADKNYARSVVLATDSIQPIDGTLVLLGAAELSDLNKSFLKDSGARGFTLVQAPEAESNSFDSLGCIVNKIWGEKSCPLGNDQILVGQRPRDQALHALTFLEKQAEGRSLDDVTIGVVDSALTGYVEQEFSKVGCNVRPAEGRSLLESSPMRLLSLLCSYSVDRSIDDLSALMRHSEFSIYLSAALDCDITDLIIELDKFIENHVAQKVDVALEILNDSTLRGAIEVLNTLTKSFRPKSRALKQWVEVFSVCLDEIYNSVAENAQIELQLEECQLLAKGLAELGVCRIASNAEKISATVVMQLLSQTIEAIAVPNEMGEIAIELLGWLELALDDAPVVFVIGFNEGNIPESITSDPFLPNNLRQELGIASNESRFSRDMYILYCLANSRDVFSLSYAKRNAQGELLLPSRLLLMAEPPLAVARVLQFCEKGDQAESLVPRPTESIDADLGFPLAPNVEDITLPKSFSVSAYQFYTQCPYRFYLRHILNLKRVDVSAKEMSAPLFGTTAHAVLAEFGMSADANLNDANKIKSAILEILSQHSRTTYGSNPPPSVALQIALLGNRLTSFAYLQSQWRRDGWRIVEVEAAIQKEQCFVDDQGKTLGLKGRIDRIDYNEQYDSWAILDYKTGESPEAITTHYKDEWKHLQLPLYYLLFQEKTPSNKLHLGFVNLSRSADKIKIASQEFSLEQVSSGIDLAKKCAEDILAKKFWPPQESVRGMDVYADICSSGMFSEINQEEHDG